MATPGSTNLTWEIPQINAASIFRTMNYSNDNSSMLIAECNLQTRVYTQTYLFFKYFHATYLRYFLVPGILLNTLCLLILSQPKLANRSTTIVFLRFLAFFDILAVTLKYVRAELNFQSTQNAREISLLTENFCRTLYILMNSCISITMWIIVLMSLDKALAVGNPLKSSIWLPHKRAIYICCGTIVLLFCVNLAFLKLSGVLEDRRGQKYCGLLPHNGIVLDLVTASILPIGIITGANILIVIILRRTSINSPNYACEESNKRDSEPALLNRSTRRLSSEQMRPSHASVSITSGIKRRTSLQVTRMLLAVTVTLLVCNVPNAIYLVWNRLSKPSKLLRSPRPKCEEVTDHDINVYYIEFYLGLLLQDILSDLPHILNFFLYCLSGQKFRSILISETQLFLFHLHFLKRRSTKHASPSQACLSRTSLPNMLNSMIDQRYITARQSALNHRKSVEVLFNGRNVHASFVNKESQELLKTNFVRESSQRSTLSNQSN